MINVDTLGKIRRWHFRQGVSIREIAKRTTLSRNTIRRYLRNDVKEPVYPARKVATKLDRFAAQMREWLECDARLPRKQRRRATKLYQQLSELGYTGSYGRVAAFVRSWMRQRGKATSQAYIPLYFSPGEAFQFDWSSESCEVGGVLMRLKVAQVRLCHSRKALAVAYPGESHEMLFDAHWRAFAYFGGVPRRGIYDNMSTAVLSHKRGEKPAFNKRFLAMASHYLFEPEACNTAAAWEKGQVERQVDDLRGALFTPRRKAVSLEALNAQLQADCERLSHERAHPEQRDRSVQRVFEEEHASLGALPVMFDGFHEKICRASHTALVHFDRNRYSVHCAYAGQMVALRAYADRIVIAAEGEVIAEHAREFGRHRTIYNPWHYLPVLERKPGALRNGAPFVDWELPRALRAMQERLSRQDDGARQFVKILAQVPGDGLEAVSVACELAIEAGAYSAEYVLNTLARMRSPLRIGPIETPEGLRLQQEPKADVARYDQLLRSSRSKKIAILVGVPLLAGLMGGAATLHFATEVKHAARA